MSQEAWGASLVVTDDDATLVLTLPTGPSSADRFPHGHPVWGAAARRLGHAAVVVSFGLGVLPGATADRLRRHAGAGGLLGALVPVTDSLS